MADYSSGAIYFTGLGSDIDFDSIIEAEISAASYKKDQLEEWSDAWQEKIDALQELNTALLELRTALQAIDSSAEFVAKDAESSDSSVATASADGDAETGNHTVVVKQLAQNDVLVNSTSFSSTTDSVTASDATFTYTYAGEEFSIAVAAGTSLTSLASLITNNSGSKGDVKAIVINDGDAYYLEIYGMDKGADNTVTIGSSTTLAGFEPADFERTQTAQDALFKVDGYPTASDAWISRDDNTVDDVIEGLTLTLRDAGTTRFTVTLDTDALQANIEEFVDQLNTVKALIDSYTAVTTDEDDEDETEGSVLTGNYGVNLVEAKIKDITASSGLGFVSYDADTGLGDYFSTLSQIGIQTDTDTSSDTYGLLVIDYDALYEALDEDPEAVASLFVADYEGDTDSSDFSFQSCVEDVTQPGEHEVSYVISGGVITAATIDGQAAVVDGWEITAAPGTDAQGLSVYVDNHADGSYGGAATVKQGKVKELVDALADITDDESGTLNIIIDNYEGIVDNAADSIEKEEARLTLLEQRLRERYAALESTLSTYQTMLDTLDTQLESLDS